MLTAQTTSPEQTHQSQGAKELTARFMLPNQVEHDCRVTDLNLTGATFLTENVARLGTPIVAYIGNLGRIEAISGPAVEGGFSITFSFTGARLERLQQRINELLNTGLGTGVAARRHVRVELAEKNSQIMLPDGRVYPCEVIDISIASAAIKTDVMPGIGTFLMLGRMKGRVICYLDSGVVIEFVKFLDAHQFQNVSEELHT